MPLRCGIDEKNTQSAALRLQSPHCAGGGCELIGLHAEPLEHGNKEIRERIVLLLIKPEMLAVTEAAPGKEHGKVCREVAAGAAEVGAKQDLGLIEQRGRTIGTCFQRSEKIEERRERGAFNKLELAQHVGVFAVVRKPVVAELDPFDKRNVPSIWHRRARCP